MIPIQFSRSNTLVRDKDGQFVPSQNIAVNLGTTVNINDNSEGATDSTWSSQRLRGEIASVVEQMVQQAVDLQQAIDESKAWTIVIESDGGRNCYNSDFKSTLTAKLYHGPDDVTDQFDDTYFRWHRESIDVDSDLYWNSTHNTGTKSINITINDMVSFSTVEFVCEFVVDDVALVTSKE